MKDEEAPDHFPPETPAGLGSSSSSSSLLPELTSSSLSEFSSAEDEEEDEEEADEEEDEKEEGEEDDEELFSFSDDEDADEVDARDPMNALFREDKIRKVLHISDITSAKSRPAPLSSRPSNRVQVGLRCRHHSLLCLSPVLLFGWLTADD